MFSPNELIRAVWAHPPQRPTDPPTRPGLYRIFLALLREGGVLNAPDAPRSWRWTALLLSVLYQSLWCLALIWLMYTRFLFIPSATPGELGEGGAIAVTWIDDTRPRATATLPTPLPEPLPESLPEPLPEPRPAPVAEHTPPAPPVSPTPDNSTPDLPESPLMLTEVDTPDADAFILPTPAFRPPETAPRASPVPAQRELTLAEVPLLQPPNAPLPAPALPQVPTLSTPELALQEREIPAPLPAIASPALRIVETPPVDLPVRERAISEREIPATLTEIELRPLVPSAPPPTLAPHTREIAEREIPLSSPVAESVREINLTPPSATPPLASSSDDAWARPSRSGTDGTGLVDEYGRPRLADKSGRPGAGLPPGTIVEDYANIDRMGIWRKRASTDYQSSQLDSLWVPHENILEEWVRRSIKNILIPIPGTDKVIRCTVVLLMLGGGCGITDPNLLDIEAGARPPPDIPFKPELHEDQESLAPGHRQHRPSPEEIE